MFYLPQVHNLWSAILKSKKVWIKIFPLNSAYIILVAKSDLIWREAIDSLFSSLFYGYQVLEVICNVWYVHCISFLNLKKWILKSTCPHGFLKR